MFSLCIVYFPGVNIGVCSCVVCVLCIFQELMQEFAHVQCVYYVFSRSQYRSLLMCSLCIMYFPGVNIGVCSCVVCVLCIFQELMQEFAHVQFVYCVSVSLVVNTFQSFPHSRLITGFVTRLTRRVPLVKQKLLTLPEHLSSPLVFSGVRVTRSLVLSVCFVDRCLSFCTFSFGHCVVCSSSIYRF